MKRVLFILASTVISACSSAEGGSQGPTTSSVATEEKVTQEEEVPTEKMVAKTVAAEEPAKDMVATESIGGAEVEPEAGVEQTALKLTMPGCVDPDLSKVQAGVQLTLCNGTTGTGTYTAPAAPDLTSLTAANIKSGVTINGVTGTYSGAVAPDLSNLTAANIKSGVTINGVTGQYPSATYPLSGADNTADLDLATFDAKIKSSANFEWFDASGARYVNAGDADLTASNVKDTVTIFGATGTFAGTTTTVEPNAKDLRKGTVVGSVTGTLKTRCRNGSNLALFDAPYPPTNNADGGADNATVNWWDTVDDFNGDGVVAATAYNPVIWAASDICYNEFNSAAADGVTDVSGQHGMKDLVSEQLWSWEQSGFGAYDTWSQAVQDCVSFDAPAGTANQWRLPTQKELMEAYTRGSKMWIGLGGDVVNTNAGNTSWYFWTSTTNSQSTGEAWVVDIRTGETVKQLKSVTARTICVK